MKSYSRDHLADPTLLQNVDAHLAENRASMAELLADLAEIDSRRLYVPAGYPSLSTYCVGELHLSEESAFKRIHAARTARRFPAIFDAIAEGRLHLSAVVMLATHFTQDNAEELLAAATHRTKAQIEKFLAWRFPKSEMMAWVMPAPGVSPAVADEGAPAAETGVLDQHAPGRVGMAEPAPAKETPLAPERYALQVTIGQSAHDNLQYAQELLSHQIAPGDIAEVLDRALKSLVRELEKRKFGAGERPRAGRAAMPGTRYVSIEVRRAVWERDGGRCTYVGDSGHRCEATTILQYDHIDPVARGGVSTVGNLRLRCRAHNQYEAERTFGAAFMAEKRRTATRPGACSEVIACLRRLGFGADEARAGAAVADSMPHMALEERVRLALRSLGKKPTNPSARAVA